MKKGLRVLLVGIVAISPLTSTLPDQIVGNMTEEPEQEWSSAHQCEGKLTDLVLRVREDSDSPGSLRRVYLCSSGELFVPGE